MSESSWALNAVCPYYTMYPLKFPLGILKRSARAGEAVLDPFCGRGTTTFAARLLGLRSMALDSSPLAVALTEAKLAAATPSEVVRCARGIVSSRRTPCDVPSGDFWELAYHPDTLQRLCVLRESLLARCDSDARILLRAILLGALHGPLTKQTPSHLSNQSPRTFAPKPAYAVRFWRRHRLLPPPVDAMEVVEHRAQRYAGPELPAAVGRVRRADNRNSRVFSGRRRFAWVITSPPYYGMRTYGPDQWLRQWFLGGPDTVDYSPPSDALEHSSQSAFAEQLAKTFRNAARVCLSGARLVARFGAIADRKLDPVPLFKSALRDAGWRVTTVREAGDALSGKRQAVQFKRVKSNPRTEFDFYARLAGAP